MISCAGGGFAGEIGALLTGFERIDDFVFAVPRVEARHLVRRFQAKHFFITRNVSHSRERGLKRSPFFWATAVRKCIKKTTIYSPDLAIFIGAVDGLPLLIACKLLGVKCIFIESVTRVNSLSVMGKMIYNLRLCNYFLVQWPGLVETYPRAMYKGAIYDLRHGRVDLF